MMDIRIIPLSKRISAEGANHISLGNAPGDDRITRSSYEALLRVGTASRLGVSMPPPMPVVFFLPECREAA
jgi:hypothetical protein